MGRIKTALVKRTAQKLMDGNQFRDNFEDNKKLIAGTMPSKRIRNMVSGYITKKTKAKMLEAAKNQNIQES